MAALLIHGYCSQIYSIYLINLIDLFQQESFENTKKLKTICTETFHLLYLLIL